MEETRDVVVAGWRRRGGQREQDPGRREEEEAEVGGGEGGEEEAAERISPRLVEAEEGTGPRRQATRSLGQTRRRRERTGLRAERCTARRALRSLAVRATGNGQRAGPRYGPRLGYSAFLPGCVVTPSSARPRTPRLLPQPAAHLATQTQAFLHSFGSSEPAHFSECMSGACR